MGLFGHKKKKTVPTTKKTQKPMDVVIFECIQPESHKGYKKVHITQYEGDENLKNYKNTEMACKKHGIGLEGAHIALIKHCCDTTFNTYLIKVMIDNKQIGIIYDGNDAYQRIIEKPIESLYCECNDQGITKEGKILAKATAKLYVK